eukprot:654445-Prymnesium_polylepis.1
MIAPCQAVRPAAVAPLGRIRCASGRPVRSSARRRHPLAACTACPVRGPCPCAGCPDGGGASRPFRRSGRQRRGCRACCCRCAEARTACAPASVAQSATSRTRHRRTTKRSTGRPEPPGGVRRGGDGPVSYTHLTLPTICSV